jgi:hypothetical protein
MKNWEDGLSRIARERLARIGELTSEEKEKMIGAEKVDSLLSEFYQGKLGAEDLWQRLKAEDKPTLLRQAQVRLADSLSFGSTPAELGRKKEGILAIETLKQEQGTPLIEADLKVMEDLQKRYRIEIEQAYGGIRAEVERNPRLRVKQVQQGQNTMAVQLTVDEAIRQLPQWQDFLSNQDKRYSKEFARAVQKLKRELR